MRVGLNKVVPLTVGGSKFVDLNALTISVPEAVEEEQPQGAARKGRGEISGIRYGLSPADGDVVAALQRSSHFVQ